MKLFLKKYAPLLGVAILSMILAIGLRLIQNISINYLEIALYINILTSTIFIRSIDDIVDYNGKSCNKDSYVIVIRKGKDEYDYHVCLKCDKDDYDNTKKSVLSIIHKLNLQNCKPVKVELKVVE